MTVRAKCNDCEERADCYKASRTVGGSYNRAASSRQVNICGPCAITRLGNWQMGQHSSNRWDRVGLIHLVEKIAPEVAAQHREGWAAYRAEQDARVERARQARNV